MTPSGYIVNDCVPRHLSRHRAEERRGKKYKNCENFQIGQKKLFFLIYYLSGVTYGAYNNASCIVLRDKNHTLVLQDTVITPKLVRKTPRLNYLSIQSIEYPDRWYTKTL